MREEVYVRSAEPTQAVIEQTREISSVLKLLISKQYQHLAWQKSSFGRSTRSNSMA